jgi:hypothetical protein
MSAWVLVHHIDGEGQLPTVGSVTRERERREVGAALAALQEPADRLTVMVGHAGGVLPWIASNEGRMYAKVKQYGGTRTIRPVRGRPGYPHVLP